MDNIVVYYSHTFNSEGPACILNIESWDGSFDILIENYEQHLHSLGKELDWNEFSHFVLWLAYCYSQRKEKQNEKV